MGHGVVSSDSIKFIFEKLEETIRLESSIGNKNKGFIWHDTSSNVASFSSWFYKLFWLLQYSLETTLLPKAMFVYV
jgi:hypothetical protein